MATGALQKVEEFVCREGMNDSVVCISARNFTGGKIGSCPILQKLAATLICLDWPILNSLFYFCNTSVKCCQGDYQCTYN